MNIKRIVAGIAACAVIGISVTACGAEDDPNWSPADYVTKASETETALNSETVFETEAAEEAAETETDTEIETSALTEETDAEVSESETEETEIPPIMTEVETEEGIDVSEHSETMSEAFEDEGEGSDTALDENAVSNITDVLNDTLTAFSKNDIKALIEFTDMEILYYFEYGEVADRELIYAALEDSGALDETLDLDTEGAEWEIVDIIPLDDERCSEMKTMLYDNDGEMFDNLFGDIDDFGLESEDISAEETVETENIETKAAETDTDIEESEEEYRIPNFEEIEEVFNITDIYCATVRISVPENEESDTEITEETDFAGTDEMMFYVFKMNGQWKVDLPYSIKYTFYKLFSEYHRNDADDVIEEAETTAATSDE